MISPPKVPGGPPSWRTPVLLIAGLTMAVIGGWLFLGTHHGATACSHQAAALCLQGFVLLTATQLLGGAIALLASPSSSPHCSWPCASSRSRSDVLEDAIGCREASRRRAP